MAAASAPVIYGEVLAQLPRIIVFGDTEQARSRGRRAIDATSATLVEDLSALELIDYLADQSGQSGIWVEFDGSPDRAQRLLLHRVEAEARWKGVPIVVSMRPECVDDVLCELSDFSAFEFVLNGTEEDRAAAAALLVARATHQASYYDMSKDESATRLRQLSEEVSRIASALARLSVASPEPLATGETIAPPVGDLPPVPPEAIRSIIRARRLRADFLPADLFADPAWDMLLDLLQAEIVQHRVPVSSLCIAAAVPPTTALRWIKTMTERGLLVRRDDPHDGRRVFIEMAPATSASLRHYFAEVGVGAI